MWYATWIENSDIAFTDDLWVTDVSTSLHPNTILRLGRYGSTCEMLGIYISV